MLKKNVITTNKNKLILNISLFIVLFLFTALNTKAYNIKLEIKNCKDNSIYLVKHKGPDFEVIDTSKIINGKAVFKGTNRLETGIYFFVIPPQTRFDFIIANEQNISISTDFRNILGEIKSSGEKQYQVFLDIQKEVAAINKKRTQMEMEMNFFKAYKKDTLPFIKKQLENLNKQQGIIYKKHLKELDNSVFLYQVLNILSPFEPPDSINKLKYENPEEHVKYYINHYLDRVDFNNANILNTPEFIFHKLLSDYCYYFFDLRIDKPNDVYSDIDKLIAKTKNNKKFNQYVLSYLISRYENPKNLKLEAYLVYLYRNYFMIERPEWVSSQAFDVMKYRIERIQDNTIGSIGKDLSLTNYNYEIISIYGIEAEYKILFFWEPSCNICTDAILELKKEYWELEPNDIQLITICTNTEEMQEWKTFVKDNNFRWINAIVNENIYNKVEFYYGTHKTPRLFILDQDNKILTKDIKPNFVYDFILNHKQKLQQNKDMFKFIFGNE